MDVLLLGAAAIVLIALTLWLVWRPADVTDDAPIRAEEPSVMIPPQGDQFEDQYTSATADLSAGGIAVGAHHEADSTAPEITEFQSAGEPWSQPYLAHEGATLAAAPERRLAIQPERRLAERQNAARPRTIGLGAAAALAVASAVAGAWLYARWQRERKKPLSRLRRRFR
jgi:hypothetical protein